MAHVLASPQRRFLSSLRAQFGLTTSLTAAELPELRLHGGHWAAYAVQDSSEEVAAGTAFWQVDMGRGTVYPSRELSMEDCPWLECKGADERERWRYHEESSGEWRLLIHTSPGTPWPTDAIYKVTSEGDKKRKYTLYFPYRRTRFLFANIYETTALPRSWVVSFSECDACDAGTEVGRIGVNSHGRWTTSSVSFSYDNCHEFGCDRTLPDSERRRHKLGEDTDGFSWDATTRLLDTPNAASISLQGTAAGSPAIIPYFNPTKAAKLHLRRMESVVSASSTGAIAAESIQTDGADSSGSCQYDDATLRKCRDIRRAWEYAVTIKSYCASSIGIEAQALSASERVSCMQAASSVAEAFEGYQTCGAVLSKCR